MNAIMKSPKDFSRFTTIYNQICSKQKILLNNSIHFRNSVYCFSSSNSKSLSRLKEGPDLKHFIAPSLNGLNIQSPEIPYLKDSDFYVTNKSVYFDVYGCQMNVNDTEIIWSILKDYGYSKSNDITKSDIVLIVTCSIRDGAEMKIRNKLDYLRGLKQKKKKHSMKIGLLGCMAERLKEKLLIEEKALDLIAGPDAYRDLPRLLAITTKNQTAANILLSLDETYADIMPVRLNEDSISAFVSIMRGCDNMCSYCIVPFTRGRERSRPIASIIQEVKKLSDSGVKEIILLGQNVNSYRDISESAHFMGLSNSEETNLVRGFKTVYKKKKGGLRFVDLLDQVSAVNPEMRVRFTSPHPKDFPDEVLYLIKERKNVCNNLHLPAQSGNSAVLERMRRGYTREAYIDLINSVKTLLPDVTLSSDFICGFCGETEEEFQDTLSLIEEIKYNNAYLFPYSMREKTTAYRRFQDDVSDEIKKDRLQRMIKTYRDISLNLNKQQIGKIQLVLVEGLSKRSEEHLAGSNDGNIRVIFPKIAIPESKDSNIERTISSGDYVTVKITSCSSQVLIGNALYHSKLSE